MYALEFFQLRRAALEGSFALRSKVPERRKGAGRGKDVANISNESKFSPRLGLP